MASQKGFYSQRIFSSAALRLRMTAYDLGYLKILEYPGKSRLSGRLLCRGTETSFGFHSPKLGLEQLLSHHRFLRQREKSVHGHCSGHIAVAHPQVHLPRLHLPVADDEHVRNF